MSVRERLRRSVSAKVAMVEKFGMVPLSVLRIVRGPLSKTIHIFQTEAGKRRLGGPEKEERKSLGIIGQSKQSDGHALSTMPAELVDFFIKYYSRPGEVYLDPFMGQGVQMQVAALRGLHYYGYDCSREFFAFIEAVAGKIKAETKIQITCGDSRYPTEIPEGIGDFCFTSPPYWDIEFYGKEPEQLGDDTYDGFLSGMEVMARAWLPKFKPGAWVVVNVNDFRRKGRFYPYHVHTIDLFTRAGYEIHDTWILDGLVGGVSKIFAVNRNSLRIAPKTHEYALVFRRPKQ